MRRQSLVLGFGLLALYAPCWGRQDLAARLFSVPTVPAGCQIIPGLYPVGDRTDLVWTYKQYSVVMPPLNRKLAQSLQCGSRRGTLYFFDYATEAEKEHALLFARPVLAKQHGVSHELAIREWSTGFVLVSFAEAPTELLAALDEHFAVKTEAPTLSKVATKSVHEAFSPVIQSQPAVQPGKVSPAIGSSPVKAAAEPVLPAQPPKIVQPAGPVKTTLSTGTPVVPPEPFVQLKPSISAEPFEASTPGKSILTPKPADTPKLPVREASPAAPPIDSVRSPEPIHEHPHLSESIAPLVNPIKAVAAPPMGAPDLSSSVLESYASRMGCENTERNLQTQTVCGFMQEFASGLPPELPFKPEPILMGPVYTIDANGRFTDLHYDALAGTRDRDVVSFFSMPSAGGKDDFEIKQLVDARKSKAPLPENDATARLPALLATKRFGIRKTNGRSATLQPTPERRLFIRRAGDHWVVIGVSGSSSETQINTSLAVAVFY